MSSEESSSASSSSTATGGEGGKRRILKPKKKAPLPANTVEHSYDRSSYVELGVALLENAKLIKTRLVDSTTDCKAYALCCAIMGTMYQFVYASILVVVFGNDVAAARNCASVPIGQTLPTSRAFIDTRRILIETALKYGHMLNTRTRISGKDCCALDNLAKLILMSDVVIFYVDPEKKRAFESYTAENQEWIVENNLAIDTRSRLVDGTFDNARTPVLSYTMSQFMSALKQISNHWRGVRWDDKLGVYVEMMRIRAGMFLTSAYGSVVHDIADLCEGESTPENPEGEYQANHIFAGTVYDVFLDLIKDMAQFAAFERIPSQMAFEMGCLMDDEEEWTDLKRKVICWIERKLAVMIATSESMYVSKYLLKMDMRPGERSGYAREFTQRLADDSSVIQKYREVDFNELCVTKKRTFIEILTEDLVKPYREQLQDQRPRFIKPELFPPEPPHVCLSLLEMIESHLTSSYFGIKWCDFWIAEPDLHKRGMDLSACDWPILIQSFNHWHLYYNGLMRCDSFLKALIAWLRVVEHHRRGKIHTWDISPWIADIASMGKKESKTKSLFKENNESGRGSDGNTSDSESEKSSSSSSPEQGSDGEDIPDIGVISVL